MHGYTIAVGRSLEMEAFRRHIYRWEDDIILLIRSKLSRDSAVSIATGYGLDD
jgi:hypothetical protein